MNDLSQSAIEAVKNASPFTSPLVEAQIVIPIVYKLHEVYLKISNRVIRKVRRILKWERGKNY